MSKRSQSPLAAAAATAQVQEPTQELATKPVEVPQQSTESADRSTEMAPQPTESGSDEIVLQLGLSTVLQVQERAYISSHAQVEMTARARTAVKRLSLTLNQQGAQLSGGKFVNGSIPFTIVWLCERLADAIDAHEQKNHESISQRA